MHSDFSALFSSDSMFLFLFGVKVKLFEGWIKKDLLLYYSCLYQSLKPRKMSDYHTLSHFSSRTTLYIYTFSGGGERLVYIKE